MSSPTQTFFPPLWRALGLSVATGYLTLGAYAALAPIHCASTYGLRAADSTPKNDVFVKRSMLWVGVRDVSIATALFAFYFEEKPREMGMLILSGMVLCVTDAVTVWNFRRDALGASVGVGAAAWGVIGWGLVGLE